MDIKSGDAILSHLDPDQVKAVTCTEGPVLIVAGAGSGKTRVLTGRIAWLLSRGVQPQNILALTFTKKAANEMKARIAQMVGDRAAARLYMGTFHSVFVRFLRDYADLLGYPSNFTIYDQNDQLSALKRIIKELGLDDKAYKPKEVLGRISQAKNNLVTPQAYAANTRAIINDTHARKPQLFKLYALYHDLLHRSGVMDFDDILLNMNILLRDYPAALEEIASRFTHIMVDEYQDTNFSQYRILMKLSAKHRNLCVVGDDSQSIYAFRGAKIENILNFQKDFPGVKLFRLERNYRSTSIIVEAANSLIAKNEGRIPKNCRATGELGEKIRLIHAYSEQEEALLIASSIIYRIQSDGAGYRDFAILYRTNAQSRAIEEALRKRNLPYMIYSGNSFFDRAEIRDMMAYLKLVVNPSDNESFRRVVNRPSRGIGETTLAALESFAMRKGRPLLEAVMDEDLQSELKPAAVAKLRLFAAMISKYAAGAAVTDAWQLVSSLSDECGLYRSFKEENTIESQARAANIEELLNAVKNFVEETHSRIVEGMIADGTLKDEDEVRASDLPVVTLGEYLEDVSLLSAVDVDEEDTDNKIALMTVHSAKGLEFPYVYVAGMEENIFPSGGMMISPEELEEERRLFYVAITRAMRAVSVSFCQTRMRNGKHESNSPSRFIKEIDSRYYANPLKAEDSAGPVASLSFLRGGSVTHSQHPGNFVPGPKSADSFVKKPNSLLSSGYTHQPSAGFKALPVMQLEKGMRIEHSKFGYGVIKKIYAPDGTDMRADIDFDHGGLKTIILRYAKISKA